MVYGFNIFIVMHFIKHKTVLFYFSMIFVHIKLFLIVLLKFNNQLHRLCYCLHVNFLVIFYSIPACYQLRMGKQKCHVVYT